MAPKECFPGKASALLGQPLCSHLLSRSWLAAPGCSFLPWGWVVLMCQPLLTMLTGVVGPGLDRTCALGGAMWSRLALGQTGAVMGNLGGKTQNTHWPAPILEGLGVPRGWAQRHPVWSLLRHLGQLGSPCQSLWAALCFQTTMCHSWSSPQNAALNVSWRRSCDSHASCSQLSSHCGCT